MNNSTLLHSETCIQASVPVLKPSNNPFSLLSSCSFNRDIISNNDDNKNINKFDSSQIGSFVRILNPTYFDDLGQIIDIDSEKEKALIKLIPRIDYKNLRKLNIQTQDRLNDVMYEHYIIPRNYFDKNAFKSEQTEYKIKVSWAPNKYIDAIKWSSEKYIGRFLYKKFHFVELFTDLDKKKYADDIQSFISNLADFEKNNSLFVQNMYKVSISDYDFNEPDIEIADEIKSSNNPTNESTHSSFQFTLKANDFNSFKQNKISKNKAKDKCNNNLDNIKSYKRKSKSQKMQTDTMKQINICWLFDKSHYPKFVDKEVLNQRRRRKTKEQSKDQKLIDIRQYIPNFMDQTKLAMLDQECKQDQNKEYTQNHDFILNTNQENSYDQQIQSINTSTSEFYSSSQQIDDEFDEFVMSKCNDNSIISNNNSNQNGMNSIEMNTSHPIEMDATNSIEMNASNSIEMNVSHPIEMNVSHPIEMSASNSIEMSASNSIEMSASNSIEMDASNSTEMNVSHPIEMSASNSIEMSASNSIEMSASNSIEMSASNSIEKNDIKTAISNLSIKGSNLNFTLPPRIKKHIKVLSQMPDDAGNIVDDNNLNSVKKIQQSNENKKNKKISHHKSEMTRPSSHDSQINESMTKNKSSRKSSYHQNKRDSHERYHRNETHRQHDKLPRRPYDSYKC